MPTDREGESEIPKIDIEKHLAHWNYFIEKLLESIDASRSKFKVEKI